MGVVYKAEELELKRIVALKFLLPKLTRGREAKDRFIQEAQSALALDHPNIRTIYKINEGWLFIAMAYYGGMRLAKKVISKQLSVNSVIDFATQIGRELAKAGINYDTTDQTFDMTETLKQYPMPLTSLKDFVRERCGKV